MNHSDETINENGELKFRGNPIVKYLMENSNVTHKDLWSISDADMDDIKEFYKLIGCPVSMFHKLNGDTKEIKFGLKEIAKINGW